MAASPTLFSPLKIGAFELAHRVVLPALTRCRAADPEGTPTPLMARYYAERATPGGLLISEATAVSSAGHVDRRTPGLYTAQQVNRWREVTDAVHGNGGVVLAQLTFVPSQSSGRHDVDAAIDAYRNAAENAGDAGFDGVELHAAHGALPDLFLRGQATAEHADYGGSAENGMRLLLEILETLAGVRGAGRVGICLSPDPREPGHDVLGDALGALPAQPVAYAHVAPAWHPGSLALDDAAPIPAEVVRSAFGGTLILSGGYCAERALSHIADGTADAIAFGRAFIANPDLPHRLRTHLPLAVPDPATFYASGAEGYVGQGA